MAANQDKHTDTSRLKNAKDDTRIQLFSMNRNGCYSLFMKVFWQQATRALGWTPRHQIFVDDIETYFASWKAWHEQTKRIEAKAA